MACAIKAVELGLNYVLLEKGVRPFQGIIDSYPKGKKVFPTIPKDETGPYPIPDLEPGAEHPPIEEHLETNDCPSRVGPVAEDRKILLILTRQQKTAILSGTQHAICPKGNLR